MRSGREVRRRRRRRSEGDYNESETTTDDEGEYDGEGFQVYDEPEGQFDVAFMERFAATLPNDAAATTTTATTTHVAGAGETLFHGENADEDAGYSSAPEYSDYGGNEGSPKAMQATCGFGGFGTVAGSANATGTRPVQLSVTQRLVKRPQLLVRKIVTGDEGKRVRDFVQDWVRMPKVVRTRDKVRAKTQLPVEMQPDAFHIHVCLSYLHTNSCVLLLLFLLSLSVLRIQDVTSGS